MFLEAICNFQWLNEPDFNFCENSICITPKKQTNFWQDQNNNISVDNGHFFYIQKQEDFSIIVKWKIPHSMPEKSQFGLMGRVDDKNWCKISFAYEKENLPVIVSSVTHSGISDFCINYTNSPEETIYYKLQKKSGKIYLFYSFDAKEYKLIRIFRFLVQSEQLKAGAYACNPSTQDVKAYLENIEII